jgi:hypothetical protein
MLIGNEAALHDLLFRRPCVLQTECHPSTNTRIQESLIAAENSRARDAFPF